MTPEEAKSRYDALYAEYQDAMHAGAWRIGWGFFFLMVGLLPMMYLFIWLVGPKAWENTLFHAPMLMWAAVPLNLGIVTFLLFRLYRRNTELDDTKRRYLAELRRLKALLPPAPEAPKAASAASEPDWDAFRDDYQRN